MPGSRPSLLACPCSEKFSSRLPLVVMANTSGLPSGCSKFNTVWRAGVYSVGTVSEGSDVSRPESNRRGPRGAQAPWPAVQGAASDSKGLQRCESLAGSRKLVFNTSFLGHRLCLPPRLLLAFGSSTATTD